MSNAALNPRRTWLLRISAVLWVIWGLVHAFAGLMTIIGDTAAGAKAIADAVDPAVLDVVYPDALGAILNQHGFNLLWFGVVTVVCAWYIWRRSVAAIIIAALVGGLADLGYFIFLDLSGYVNFVPGTVMTLISSSAIILSFVSFFGNKAKHA